jgi:hypothetical protein
MCLTKKRKRLMSKKLIAVASAAALALSALVAAPASASVSVSWDGQYEGEGLTKADALIIDVPSANKLVYSDDTDRTLIEGTYTLAAKGDVITVATTGKVRVIEEETTTTNKYTSASGATSWSYTAKSNNDNVAFFVYTTSSAAETFTVTVGKNSTEYWIQGQAGPEYNLAVTAPSSVAANTTPTKPNVTAVVTDVFGNVLDESSVDADTLGGGASIVEAENFFDEDTESFGWILTTDAAGDFALTVTMEKPAPVTGLAKPVYTFFRTIGSASLETQVADLTAQVAALQASLDASRPKAKSVTKKRYNTLARKWNAAFPSQRVALKK